MNTYYIYGGAYTNPLQRIKKKIEQEERDKQWLLIEGQKKIANVIKERNKLDKIINDYNDKLDEYNIDASGEEYLRKSDISKRAYAELLPQIQIAKKLKLAYNPTKDYIENIKKISDDDDEYLKTQLPSSIYRSKLMGTQPDIEEIVEKTVKKAIGDTINDINQQERFKKIRKTLPSIFKSSSSPLVSENIIIPGEEEKKKEVVEELNKDNEYFKEDIDTLYENIKKGEENFDQTKNKNKQGDINEKIIIPNIEKLFNYIKDSNISEEIKKYSRNKLDDFFEGYGYQSSTDIINKINLLKKNIFTYNGKYFLEKMVYDGRKRKYIPITSKQELEEYLKYNQINIDTIYKLLLDKQNTTVNMHVVYNLYKTYVKLIISTYY